MVLLEHLPGKITVYGSRSEDKGLPGFALGKVLFVYDNASYRDDHSKIWNHMNDPEMEQAWARGYTNRVGTSKIEEWVRVG